MIVNNIIYVFHIRKHNGAGIFLHPFKEFDKIISSGNSFQLEGRYGEEPVIECFTAFRNELYRIVEDSVNNWVSESKFIPRFLISAFVFLITYFFFSFAIKIPIPIVVDKIILGIVAAIICYNFLGRKYIKTTTASKLRAHYRGIVDRIVFSKSNFIVALESFLVQINGKTVEDIIQNSSGYSEFAELISEENMEERNQFILYIERLLKKQLSGQQRRLVNKIVMMSLDKTGDLIKELDLVNIAVEIDVNLFISYLLLRQKNSKKNIY
ncbi:MAG: hypothetical protein FWF38_06105 [Spirochaetaceae bacterium]|nr:hypothetical protein [Spirochaetaceae bacterium]